jgi:hypothetical protein
MLPVEFEQCNFTFNKPEGATDEECLPLRVFKGKDTIGWPVIISKWNFSKEDLEEIQRTGCVYLTICSAGMPPVTLQTESPFTQS